MCRAVRRWRATAGYLDQHGCNLRTALADRRVAAAVLVRRVVGRVLYNAGAFLLEITSAFAVAGLVQLAAGVDRMPWYAALAGALTAPLASTLLALAAGPEVLLLDEPCSALDPRSTAVIEDLIVSLAEELAVVIVTHNLQQAQRVADHVAFMFLGELVESGRLGTAVRVGVRSDEGPSALAQEADVMVEGTDGVRDMLQALLD